MAQAERLTEEESRTMKVLWDRGGASVGELAMALDSRPDRTLALLRRLRRKGAVDRHRTGRSVLYRPCLNRTTAPTHTLGRLLAGGAPGGLGVVVLRESDVAPEDWADLQAEMAARPRRRA